MMKFKKEYLNEVIKELGFTEFTKIQKAVIPKALAGKSIVGCSKTGSGKTHSFLLPIFENLEDIAGVQAVITTPTRELAEQIYIAANLLASKSAKKIDIRMYTGGTDRAKEIKNLRSQPTIVIGTPGKLQDLVIKEKKLFIHTTKIFVIDEADMALEEGFLVEIDQIGSQMPKTLQMLVFSATIPKGLEPFLKKYMNNPEFIFISNNQMYNESIEHILINSKYKSKKKLLVDLLKITNPFLVIIFANTKTKVIELAEFLKHNGFKIAEIHGDLSVRVRKQMMRRVRNLEFQYIVATDIAARGIDIDDVSHVINFELPTDVEFYVHRTGRTGRIGKSGIAISFYDFDSYDYLDKLDSKKIKFNFKDIKNGELIDSKVRNQREKKQFKAKDIDKARLLVKKKVNKNVKPGYKKKREKEAKELAKKLSRSSKTRRKR